MANTLENTLDKASQTCLERFGMEARKEHLYRNEWLKDLQYTKALVNAEYDIQTEFEISSYGEDLEEMGKVEMNGNLSEADWKEVGKYEKKLEKQVKKEQKRNKKQEKRKDKNVNKKADQGRIDENGNTTPLEKPVVQTVFHGNSVVLNEKYNPSENYVDWRNRY